MLGVARGWICNTGSCKTCISHSKFECARGKSVINCVRQMSRHRTRDFEATSAISRVSKWYASGKDSGLILATGSVWSGRRSPTLNHLFVFRRFGARFPLEESPSTLGHECPDCVHALRH